MYGNNNQRERTIIEIINIGKNIKCIYDNMNLQNKEALEKELRVEITKENYLLDFLNCLQITDQKDLSYSLHNN